MRKREILLYAQLMRLTNPLLKSSQWLYKENFDLIMKHIFKHVKTALVKPHSHLDNKNDR